MDLASLDRRPGRALSAVVVLTLLVLAPFLGKAFHIDDPLFLATARQVARKPLDPYGFRFNWYGDEMPMWEITKNPPLSAYLLAAAGRALGWSEVPLHLVLLLPAAAVVAGTSLLARRLGGSPALAAALVLAAPAFLVSATGLMCDVTMLALWVFAVLLWIDGIARDDARRLAGSACLIAAASLTKYFAISLIPLLAAWTLLRRRPAWRRLAVLAIPVAALVAYQAATHRLYGRGLLLDAAAYATGEGRAGSSFGAARALLGLAFTGGCLFPALAFAPRLWSKTVLGAGLAAGAVSGAALAAGLLAGGGAVLPPAWRAPGALQFAVFVAGGLSVLGLAGAALRERSDAGALLGLWIAGTFVFASFVNWSVNGRSVLPMAPAAALLIARRIAGDRAAARRTRLRSAAPLALAAAVALAVAAADARLAADGRQAAALVRARTAGDRGTLWFFGHWGFQEYMEAIGAKPIDAATSRFRPGDRVVVPSNTTNARDVPEAWVGSREAIELDGPFWLTTLHMARAAGFYASELGPLPFSFGPVPPERYEIVRIGGVPPARP